MGSQSASWRNDFLEERDGYDKDGKVSPLGKGRRRGEKWPEKWLRRGEWRVGAGGANGGVRACADASLSEAWPGGSKCHPDLR